MRRQGDNLTEFFSSQRLEKKPSGGRQPERAKFLFNRCVVKIGMTVGGWPYSPVRWLAPGPPVSRTNQDRLVSPDIVPNPRFSAAWKTPGHDACLSNFANFQIEIFRRELDR